MSRVSTQLYEVLYVSTLAPDTPINVVADITRKARLTNQAANITGLLIFDGLRFCEQLEGEQKNVVKLVERIQDDPRHTEMHILHNGPLDARRFKRFSMGYALVEDTEALEAIKKLDGTPAVEAFLALLPTLDLDAWAAAPKRPRPINRNHQISAQRAARSALSARGGASGSQLK